MVSIPSDLRKNKETIIGNMELRECICLFLGLIISISILYFVRIVLGYKKIVVIAFFSGIFLIPFLLIGFKRKNGMKVEDYLKVFINNKILANRERLPIGLLEEKEVNKKYELIKYYKIQDKEEIPLIRECLKDILILTEYIDYKNEKYLILRLDGKDLILEQIKKEKKNKKHNKKTKKKNSKNMTINEIRDKIDVLKDNKALKDLDDLKRLMENIKNDDREICELNLFNVGTYKDYVSGKDKIIFINNKEQVDTFIFDDNQKNSIVVDLFIIDKEKNLYKETLLSLEARNSFNQYRKINSLLEI